MVAGLIAALALTVAVVIDVMYWLNRNNPYW